MSGSRDVRHVRSVLFVCMGNICRSPLAQGVFEHLADRRGVRGQLTIESRGTGGWHVGEAPDPRTIAVARRNGISLQSRAQQFDPTADFRRFELILAMDRQNLAHILGLGGTPDRCLLFREFDPLARPDPEKPDRARGNLDVPDPYHGGPEGFENGFTMVHRTAMALLDAMFPTKTES